MPRRWERCPRSSGRTGSTSVGKDIPRERYLTKEWHDLEVERVWGRTWQMACRESDIPNVGDQTVYDVADRSVLLVRVSANAVQAEKDRLHASRHDAA